MEFLSELDVPERPISQEIDVARVPGLDDALRSVPNAEGGAPVADALVADQAPSTADDELATGAGPEAALPPLADGHISATHESAATESARPEPPPRSPGELLAERRLRLIVRVHTCRDAFRMLGFLGIAEDARRSVAKMLMALDEAANAERPDQPPAKLVKDPDTVLASAPNTLLELLEARLAPIEDKLLALDDGVSREDFRRRVMSGKHPRKLLARYGRLLASRRLPAGPRRDRFEWLATHLLTARDEAGVLVAISKESALPVLQHLIGGLQHRPDPKELHEAVAYLKEAREKLREFTSHEEFFDSGYFLDVHGYRVSVRDQLLNPDFLYLSAALNADIENVLNGWIAELEKLHKANQLTREGSPRERIMALLHEQEEAVDNIFGVRRRRPPEVQSIAVAKAEEAQRRRQAEKRQQRRARRKARTQRRLLPDLGFDSQTLGFAALVLVILGAGAYIAWSTGAVGAPTIEYIEDDHLASVSPVLARGLFKGEASEKTLEGAVLDKVWEELSPTDKQEAAERLGRLLAKRDVREARVTRVYDGTPVITIRDGLVVYVAGVINRQ